MLVKIVHGFKMTIITFELNAKFDKKSSPPDAERIIFASKNIKAFINIILVNPLVVFWYKFILILTISNLKQI
jgi:hypothetical protein